MFDQLRTAAVQKAFLGEGNFGLLMPSDSGGGGGFDWMQIINRGFDLGSQFMQSYGGRTVGTQTYGSGGQVFTVQAKPSHDDGYQYSPAVGMVQQPGGVGGTVGSGVDGIFNWLMANPVITFGGIAALYLLFKEPPRRR